MCYNRSLRWRWFTNSLAAAEPTARELELLEALGRCGLEGSSTTLHWKTLDPRLSHLSGLSWQTGSSRCTDSLEIAKGRFHKRARHLIFKQMQLPHTRGRLSRVTKTQRQSLEKARPRDAW